MAQTTEQILAAAAALESRGERVSIRSVRAELGGGDPATIGRVLKQRREGAVEPERPVLALPNTLTRALAEWAGEMAAGKVESIRAELETAHNDNETLLAQVEELQAQMNTQAEQLAAEQKAHDITKGELRALRDALDKAGQENKHLIAECATAKEQAKAAEQRANAAETRAERATDDLRALIQRGSEDTPEPETPPNQDGMEPRGTEPEAEPEPETKAAAPSKPRVKRPPTAQEQKLLNKYGAEAKAKLAENAKEG